MEGQHANQSHEPQDPEASMGDTREILPLIEALEDDIDPHNITFGDDIKLFRGKAQKKNREVIFPEEHSKILINDETALMPKHKVAIIYEYSQDTLKQRKNNRCFDTYEPTEGPLDVRSLYQHLRKPRFASCHAHSNRKEHDSQDESSRNQRVIYITNIDAWTVPAIISPASPKEVELLGAFIPNFLEKKSSYKINIPAIIGRPATFFTFEFQLSFYTLRVWRKPAYTDKRWGGNAKFRRRSQNLTALSKKGKAWLHEAKAGCLMFGNDSSFWNAYVLIDNYYEKDSEDDIQWYGINDDDTYSYDFPTRGHLDATKTLNTPQEYFFTVLCHRLAACSSEQNNILEYLERKHGQIPQRNPEWSPQEARNHPDTMRHSYGPVSEIARTCSDVEASLSFIVQSLESCGNPDICPLLRNIEPNSASFENITNMCQEMQATLNELENIRRHLAYLRKKCERFEKEASKPCTQLKLGSSPNTTEQFEVVINNNTHFFQQLGLFFSAPGLSANLLQSDLVLIKPRWLQFVFLAIVFRFLPRLINWMTEFGTYMFKKMRSRAGVFSIDQLKFATVEESSETENCVDGDDEDEYDDDDEQDIPKVREEQKSAERAVGDEGTKETNIAEGTQPESSTANSHTTSIGTFKLKQRKGKSIATSVVTDPHHMTNEDLFSPAEHSSAKEEKSVFEPVLRQAGNSFLLFIRKVLTNNQYGSHSDIEMGQVSRDTANQSNSSSWHGHTSGHQEI